MKPGFDREKWWQFGEGGLEELDKCTDMGMTSMSCMFSNKLNSVILHGVGWKEEGKLYHISNINGHTIQSNSLRIPVAKALGI